MHGGQKKGRKVGQYPSFSPRSPTTNKAIITEQDRDIETKE
jgi:hypothetical protein